MLCSKIDVSVKLFRSTTLFGHVFPCDPKSVIENFTSISTCGLDIQTAASFTTFVLAVIGTTFSGRPLNWTGDGGFLTLQREYPEYTAFLILLWIAIHIHNLPDLW